MKNDYFVGKGICYLAAGSEHSLAITLSGLLYTWGSNSKGQLGISTLGKDFRRIGLPRLQEDYLSAPIALVACGLKSSYFAAAGKHAEVNSYLFSLWRKKLIFSERKSTEEANYRYSIVRRDMNRDKLTRRIHAQREASLGRLSLSPDTSRRKDLEDTTESYYEFWNSDTCITLEDTARRIHSYARPQHARRHGGVTVTVFSGFGEDGQQKKSEGKQAERPTYYERTEFRPTVRRFQTIKTQTLFAPYCLSPNPMLLGPVRKIG